MRTAVRGLLLHLALARSVPSHETAHAIAATQKPGVDMGWDGSCGSEPNPNPLVFEQNCAGKDGCWPLAYVIGVQKAATTSLANMMLQCGIVAYGSLNPHVHRLSDYKDECPKYDFPCKEMLHDPIDIRTKSGRREYEQMHDTTRCNKVYTRPNNVESCTAGRFLEATPMDNGGDPHGETEASKNLVTLMRVMPSHVKQVARFVIVVREPISRMLSWFNHLRRDNGRMIKEIGGTAASEVDYSSFERFFRTSRAVDRPSTAFDKGIYIRHLNLFREDDSVSRRQLLVMAFDRLVGMTSEAVREITTHLGLPILPGVNALPEENFSGIRSGPEQLVTVKCSTLSEADRAYEPHNRALYRAMHDDHRRNRQPPEEQKLRSFKVDIPCTHNGKERTVGGHTLPLD